MSAICRNSVFVQAICSKFASVSTQNQQGFFMFARFVRCWTTALTLVIGLMMASVASASVVVTITGNQAVANISLTDTRGTFSADVTITFDTPVNLTPFELNLTAALVDPSDPTVLTRLGCPSQSCLVTIDPAFPMQIMVEPLALPQSRWSLISSPSQDRGLRVARPLEYPHASVHPTTARHAIRAA